MRWKNTIDAYGSVSMLLHWLTAAAFIAAYVIAYYVIWIVDPETSVKPPLFGLAPDGDRVVPILNLHWVLGISIGFLVLPRLLWRMFGTSPRALGGSNAETVAADVAHWALYALLIVMPLSGYMNTYDPTDFGLFVIPAFKDTSFFAWVSSTFGVSWPDVGGGGGAGRMPSGLVRAVVITEPPVISARRPLIAFIGTLRVRRRSLFGR